MTREQMGALLGMTLLIDTEELLDTLWAKADALEKAGEPLRGDRYSILEGHASIWGMWCELHDYAAGRPVDFVERLALFDDSAEVAGWLAEMGKEEEVKAFETGEYYEQTYESAAQCLLTLYGLMALAAAAQAEEANVDLDNEGGAGISDDLMFLRLFNEFAAANPRAADEWLFVGGGCDFTWNVDEERMVFQPQDDADPVPVDDLPFMDDPFFIGADMASGHDTTVISKPIAREPSRQNRLSVIRISFFVLCQGCLRTSICSKEKHCGMELCQCGGQWCGCANCHETVSALLRGERDQNALGLQVPISSWSPVNGCVVAGGAV